MAGIMTLRKAGNDFSSATVEIGLGADAAHDFSRDNEKRDLRKASDSELIVAVRQYMARRPGVRVGLKQLADSLGIAPRLLTMAFQRSLGISVAVYVRHERMRLAQRILLQSSRPIQDIATELGFSGAANFASAFREFSGMTPSEFRKSPPDHLALTTNTDMPWGQGPV